MYDKCYFCLDQLPKLKKESTASFFVNFGGAGVQNRDGTERSLQSDHGSNGLNSEKGLNGEMRFWNKMRSIGQKIDES